MYRGHTRLIRTRLPWRRPAHLVTSSPLPRAFVPLRRSLALGIHVIKRNALHYSSMNSVKARVKEKAQSHPARLDVAALASIRGASGARLAATALQMLGPAGDAGQRDGLFCG